MQWTEPRPWAGGTFLHRLPKHARTGPALTAYPLTQISRSQAFSVPCLSPLKLLPHQVSSGTSLTGKGRKRW